MNLNFDNKVFRALGKIVDCFVLTFLWLICCIPIITIGASTTAFYYTTHKVIRRSRGYLLSSFFASFRENFKQTTVLWLIILLIHLVLVYDLVTMYTVLMAGNSIGYLFYAFLVLSALVMIWSMYVFAYAARFSNTNRAILKNCAIIAVVNIPASLLVLVLVFCSGVLVYFFPPLLFLVPAFTFISFDLILEKVFRKYMSAEDLAAEEEDDRMDLQED